MSMEIILGEIDQGDGVCWLYQCPVEQKNS